jgi:hypothetical protein
MSVTHCALGNRPVTDKGSLAYRAAAHRTSLAGNPRPLNPCAACGAEMGYPWWDPNELDRFWPERALTVRPDKRHCSNACRQDAYRKRKLGAA